jgi:tRNA1Val (adenine37-N6)-methyltransferase
MANNYFKFKQFTIHQEHAAFKVTTDSVLLGAWAGFDGVQSVLDAGTGTGILALMAAQRSDALIVAVEPDRTSFMQAGLNITNSPWHERITLINSALQDYLPEHGLLFDMIITNPPFFTASLPNRDTRKAATRHALTLTPEELIEAAQRLLAPDGTLQLVLPVTEALLFVGMASSAGFYCNRRLSVRPTPSLPPARVLMSLSCNDDGCEDSEIVIEKGGRHIYSEEYVSLTKDFYLRF